MADPKTPAHHAEHLAYAVAELLRFSRDGAETPRFPFGMDDITATLAEALHFTLTIENAALASDGDPIDSPDRESGEQLAAALAKWLADNGFEGELYR